MSMDPKGTMTQRDIGVGRTKNFRSRGGWGHYALRAGDAQTIFQMVLGILCMGKLGKMMAQMDGMWDKFWGKFPFQRCRPWSMVSSPGISSNRKRSGRCSNRWTSAPGTAGRSSNSWTKRGTATSISRCLGPKVWGHDGEKGWKMYNGSMVCIQKWPENEWFFVMLNHVDMKKTSTFSLEHKFEERLVLKKSRMEVQRIDCNFMGKDDEVIIHWKLASLICRPSQIFLCWLLRHFLVWVSYFSLYCMTIIGCSAPEEFMEGCLRLRGPAKEAWSHDPQLQAGLAQSEMRLWTLPAWWTRAGGLRAARSGPRLGDAIWKGDDSNEKPGVFEDSHENFMVF